MRRPRAEADGHGTEQATIRRVADDEALAVWRGLERGDWVVIERFDDESGRRILLASLKRRPAARPWHRLSAREQAVVAEVAAGRTNREAASSLGVSVSTVAGHLRSARRKLGGARRMELVLEWRGRLGRG